VYRLVTSQPFFSLLTWTMISVFTVVFERNEFGSGIVSLGPSDGSSVTCSSDRPPNPQISPLIAERMWHSRLRRGSQTFRWRLGTITNRVREVISNRSSPVCLRTHWNLYEDGAGRPALSNSSRAYFGLSS
jgi:hypothetical protein